MKAVSVGDVSEQVRGVSYAKSESSEEPRPGYVAVLRANNITDEGLTFDDLVYVPAARVSAKQRIHANDVVIAASSGSLSVVGKAAQARQPVDGSFGAFCKVLRPNGEVDPLYFGHFFRTPAYRRTVSGLAAGANINNLKNEHLDDLQIPLPPIPEQKRIAAILDAADALRAKRRESIEQLDSLVQATFREMFGDPVTNPMGWEPSTLGVMCDIQTGYAWKAAKFNADGIGTPVIRIQNVGTSDVELIHTEEPPISRFWVTPSELLLTLSGSFRLAKWSGPKALLNQRIARLTVKAGINQSFIEHALAARLHTIEAMGRHSLVNNVALAVSAG